MTRGSGGFVLVLLPFLAAAACETLPAARHLDAPVAPVATTMTDFLTPEPTWPQHVSPPAPPMPTVAAFEWLKPSTGSAPLNIASTNSSLPLPDVRAVPVHQSAPSRSWGPLPKPSTPSLAFVAPSTPTAVASANESPKTPGSTPTAKAGTTKTPTAALPVPTGKTTTASPPTAASKAQLLPSEKTEAADYQWQDVNASAGDQVTLHFDKTNWIYLDTPAQQKALGFQSISRDKDATTFQFKPPTAGQWVLEFQRQDLAAGTTELRKVNLHIAVAGTRTSSTGTAQAPQTSTKAANDALEAARQLAAAGKTPEAVKKLLEGYKADDARTNLELARLLDQSGQDDQALDYVGKNLDLPGPDFAASLELGTKLAATAKDPSKALPPYVKLWLAGTTAPAEDVYVQVLEALRTQKLGASARDWAAKYTPWYPNPKLRDRYLFQYGQLLEEPGEGRDVRGAWKAYDEIVRSFPLSPVWKAAGDRAAYLNRTFLQVR